MGVLTFKPLAVTHEANHIRELLETKGKTAKVKLLPVTMAPCRMREKRERIIADICANSDCAVTMCCSAGFLGIKNALPKTFKTFPGMNPEQILARDAIADGATTRRNVEDLENHQLAILSSQLKKLIRQEATV